MLYRFLTSLRMQINDVLKILHENSTTPVSINIIQDVYKKTTIYIRPENNLTDQTTTSTGIRQD